MYGYTQDKDKYLNRLRRIEGQVRGLEKMVEEDKYCIDILTQVAAATSALQSVALGLLEDHLGHCVAQATAEGGEVAAAKVREASEAIARLVKSLPSRPARRRSPGSSPTDTDRRDGSGPAPRPSASRRASPPRRAAPTPG
jgi:CsoR family transcriptional regulator, copper-sensing transcriptional repressor